MEPADALQSVHHGGPVPMCLHVESKQVPLLVDALAVCARGHRQGAVSTLRVPRCETLMFLFLPCDAQTRDLKYEVDLRGRARKHIGAVGAPRGACA